MKNILVTGCSRGLGLEITEMLLAEGYTVYGLSRKSSSAMNMLEKKYKYTFVPFNYDLEDIDNIKPELFGKLLDKVPLYGLVNNAAIAYDDIITNIDNNKLEQMFKINLTAPMILTKYTIRNMLLYGNAGSIVNISSISAHTGYKGLAMYAATKGALEAFAKNASREWGSKGIRFNNVVAGFMETDMNAGLTDEQKAKVYARTSLKKGVDIKSAAATVKFLLSEEANSITGHNIFVESGTI